MLLLSEVYSLVSLPADLKSFTGQSVQYSTLGPRLKVGTSVILLFSGTFLAAATVILLSNHDLLPNNK